MSRLMRDGRKRFPPHCAYGAEQAGENSLPAACLLVGRAGRLPPNPLPFRPPECLPAKVLTTAGTARIFCERTAGPQFGWWVG